MAEELNENIIELTRLTLKKAILQQELKLAKSDENRTKQINLAIKNIEAETAKRRAYIQIGNQTVQQIEKEISKKKELQKTYEEQVKIIQASSKSIKEQNIAIKDLQRNMSKQSGREVRDITSTFSTVLTTLKGFDVKKFATTWTSAGGVIGLAKNSIAALGGAASASALGLGLLAKGIMVAYDNLVAPSARMRNVAGQQLGISAANRNLFGGQFLKEWANRFSLGYSTEEQASLYSTLVGAVRLNPTTNTKLYESGLQGLMSAQRIWGVDNATLGTISKAYSQVGVSAERLGSKFDMLMRNVDGTGWTTSEYSTVLANNVMYLKNFGVNIDTFAQELKGYGNLVKQEKLTLQDVSTGGWQRETTGNLAFMAQEFLKSGLISERELGAGLGDTVFAQAGALKEYLGKKIKAGEISEIVQLFESNPMFRSLMESSGALGSKFAFKELLSTAGLPLSSEIATVFQGKSAETAWDIGHGRLSATSSGEFVGEKSLKELSDEARENYAATSNSLKRLLLEIANLIRKEADNMGAGNPLDITMK